jgi:hypothetical protein
MLALACLAIALVATLMRRPARVRLVWLFVPVAVALVAVIPFVAPGRSYPVCLVLSLAAMAVPLLVVALGAVVTTVTLWRRSRWLGIAWAGVLARHHRVPRVLDGRGGRASAAVPSHHDARPRGPRRPAYR